MKLRNKILLSYILLIVLLICGVYIFFDLYAIGQLTEKHIDLAEASVGNITKFNRQLSRRNLSVLGKIIIRLRTECVALEVSEYLSKKTPEYLRDYATLRKDQKLRKLVVTPVLVYGKDAGYSDMMDRKGEAIIHKNPNIEGRNYKEWSKKYPQMWDYVKQAFQKDMVSGSYKFIDENNNENDKFMVTCKIPNTPFMLTTAVSINRYFGPVHEQLSIKEKQFSDIVDAKIQRSSTLFSTKIRLLSIPFIFIILCLSSLFGLWLSGNITAPLKRLLSGVKKMGEGDFSVKVEEAGSYETCELAKAFNQLGGQLCDYIKSLKEETAARQSVESEIKIAREIQQSLLPRKFPQSEYYTVNAMLEPAKEVAGDFYDTFEINGKLIMIIGDVSGKGVPAAFFMAVVRTLLRDLCFSHDDPGKILTLANRILCQENETCMFVTLFLAIYDVEKGIMTYANGGHNEVERIKEDTTTANFGLTGDMALGIMPENTYRSKTEAIDSGDTLIMYTDGVTEAISPDQVLYGTNRLSQLISSTLKGAKSDQLCPAIVEDVIKYESGNRFDDITVMVFSKN